MLDENDLQKLLRLKRYEQPPPGYHERFLHDFHRRQREELLRRPLWRIVLDRTQNYFGEHRALNYAYASAAALVVAFAGIASFELGTADHGATTASDDREPVVATRAFAGSADIAQPRYVIDTRPVSYEPPSSF